MDTKSILILTAMSFALGHLSGLVHGGVKWVMTHALHIPAPLDARIAHATGFDPDARMAALEPTIEKMIDDKLGAVIAARLPK